MLYLRTVEEKDRNSSSMNTMFYFCLSNINYLLFCLTYSMYLCGKISLYLYVHYFAFGYFNNSKRAIKPRCTASGPSAILMHLAIAKKPVNGKSRDTPAPPCI